MAERKKQSLLNGTLILSAAVIAVKIISVLFKLYITHKVTYSGMAYYDTAFNIYQPVYAIALAGLPTAVSKLVSTKAAEGKYNDVKSLFKVSKLIFLLMGVIGMSAVLVAAWPYANSISSLNSIPSLIAIAPSVLFCCIMSCYRGYYQGMRNMTPSAVSQMLEAAGKLIVGFVLINLILATGTSFAGNIPGLSGIVTEPLYSYTACGAIIGVTAGSVIGLIYLIIRSRLDRTTLPSSLLETSPASASKKSLAKELILLAIPIALSSLVFNITTFIDNWTVQNRLQYVLENNYEAVASLFPGIISAKDWSLASASEAGMTVSEVSTKLKDYLYGSYGTVLEIKNLVPTLTITLGLSAIPVMSEAWVKKDRESIKESVDSVLRITLLIAMPAGIGMVALAKDILYLLFSRSAENVPALEYMAPILMMYGVSVVFLALAEPVMNMLQAVDKLKTPILLMGVGAAVKVVANYFLVAIPSVNLKGAVIGSFLCNLVMVFGGLFVLLRHTEVKLKLRDIVVKPLLCALLCGAAAYSVNLIFEKLLAGFGSGFLCGDNIACVLGVFAAMLTYFFALLLTRTVTEKEINMLPKGEKIVKVLAKLRLIR